MAVLVAGAVLTGGSTEHMGNGRRESHIVCVVVAQKPAEEEGEGKSTCAAARQSKRKGEREDNKHKIKCEFKGVF